MICLPHKTYAIFKTIVTDEDLELPTYNEVLFRALQAEKRHMHQLPMIAE